MPAGLKSLVKKDSTSTSLTDISEAKKKNQKKKRPFSLGIENYLPMPQIHLSPLGGAISKLPAHSRQRLSSPADSETLGDSKGKLDSLEMDTFKVILGDGTEIGSSSTDDVHDAIVRQCAGREYLKPYDSPLSRSRSHQRIQELLGSVAQSGSSENEGVLSLSPTGTDSTEDGCDPILHSTPKLSKTEKFWDPLQTGSEKFHQTFIVDQPRSPGHSQASSATIPSPSLNASFRSDTLSPTASFTTKSWSSFSSLESSASHFSYSDIPAITVTVVNETDEVTQL